MRYDSLWRPCSASIICVGDILFAFNLAEMTEYVPAKEVNGRYIRDETMFRWMRGKYDKPFRYVIKHALPTGRFFLQLYSAYTASLAELNGIMIQWAEDKRIEQFLRDVEKDVASIDEQQKAQIMERLQLARQFLLEDTAVERLLKWQTPLERLLK